MQKDDKKNIRQSKVKKDLGKQMFKRFPGRKYKRLPRFATLDTRYAILDKQYAVLDTQYATPFNIRVDSGLVK